MEGIVLCSPEDIYFRFGEYELLIKSVKHMGRLSRIVVHGVHLTILSNNFCPSIAAMKRVRPETFEVSIVLMSMTVPKKMEKEMLASLGCDFNRLANHPGEFDKREYKHLSGESQ